jgi:hypothetical protein
MVFETYFATDLFTKQQINNKNQTTVLPPSPTLTDAVSYQKIVQSNWPPPVHFALFANKSNPFNIRSLARSPPFSFYVFLSLNCPRIKVDLFSFFQIQLVFYLIIRFK